MKRLLCRLLAISLLSGTALSASAALAQAPQSNSRDQSGKPSKPKQDAKKQAEQKRATQQRTQQQPVQQRARQLRTQQQQTTQQQSATRRRWSRGDRLSDQYRQSQYTVSNWQYYGLQRPPHGYQWHRDDQNNFFLVVISTGVIAAPVLWADRERRWNENYHRTYSYNDDIYFRECRAKPDPAGILPGGLIGALIGNTAGHGNRAGATIAGIIIGGAAGAALTNHMDCGDRSYAYKIYSSGFNDGRANHDYGWQNPGNGHRGSFRVTRYFYDRYGFRCAEFRQTLDYMGRNDRDRNGRACLQPNGAWVIVN